MIVMEDTEVKAKPPRTQVLPAAGWHITPEDLPLLADLPGTGPPLPPPPTEPDPPELARYVERFTRYWPRTPYYTRWGYREKWYKAKAGNKDRRLNDGGLILGHADRPDKHIRKSWPRGAAKFPLRGRLLQLPGPITLPLRRPSKYHYLEYGPDHGAPPARWPADIDKLISLHLTPNSHFWLGMEAPASTTVICLDSDNSRDGHGKRDSQVGWYDSGDGDRPLMLLSIDSLRRLHTTHTEAPACLVWCISSASLSVHAWQILDLPTPLAKLHYWYRTMAGIGVEVHPNNERCLRRPLGTDYATILPGGTLLTDWREQMRNFEGPTARPSWEDVFDALTTAWLGQWLDAARAGCVFEDNCQPFIRRWQEVMAWRDAGFPAADHRPTPTAELQSQAEVPAATPVSLPEGALPPTDVLPPILRNLDSLRKPPAGLPAGALPPTDVLPPILRLDTADDQEPEGARQRNANQAPDVCRVNKGRWAFDLLRWAEEGVPESRSWPNIVSQFTTWLWFVELADLPAADREEEIRRLMWTWLTTRHNGQVRRLEAGDAAEVENVRSQMERFMRIGRKQDQKGKYILAGVRQKRDRGAYRHQIDIVPVLEGRAATAEVQVQASCPVPCFTPCAYSVPISLPADVEKTILDAHGKKVRCRNGRVPVLDFAVKVLGALLSAPHHTASLNQKWFIAAGFKSDAQREAYKLALVKAGLLEVGTYRRHAHARRYGLTAKAKELLLPAAETKRA